MPAPAFGRVKERTGLVRIISFPLDRTGLWAGYDERWLPDEGRLVYRRGPEVVELKSFYSHHDPLGRWRMEIGYRDLSATIRFSQDLPPLTLAPSGVFSGAVNPDGSRLALAMLDGSLRVFDTATWQEMAGRPAVQESAPNALWSVDFSPDGKRLALGWQRGAIMMWDVGLAKTIWQNPTAHDRNRPVVTLEFSPDGERLLSASSDETARVWSAEHGHQESVLRGHTLNVTSARWSPDGERILTTSLDETVKLWVPSTGQEVVTLFDLKAFTVGDAVMGAGFSDDGFSVHIATRKGHLHSVRTLPWKAGSFPCEPDAGDFLRCLEEWKRVTRLGTGTPPGSEW
jgi:WD40 repeat protein